MTDVEEVKAMLAEAKKLDLNRVIILGISEENGSVVIHNAGTDMDAAFLLKTFTSTLEMSIWEDLYARTKPILN
jgi:hypothetical protein